MNCSSVLKRKALLTQNESCVGSRSLPAQQANPINTKYSPVMMFPPEIMNSAKSSNSNVFNQFDSTAEKPRYKRSNLVHARHLQPGSNFIGNNLNNFYSSFARMDRLNSHYVRKPVPVTQMRSFNPVSSNLQRLNPSLKTNLFQNVNSIGKKSMTESQILAYKNWSKQEEEKRNKIMEFNPNQYYEEMQYLKSKNSHKEKYQQHHPYYFRQKMLQQTMFQQKVAARYNQRLPTASNKITKSSLMPSCSVIYKPEVDHLIGSCNSGLQYKNKLEQREYFNNCLSTRSQKSSTALKSDKQSFNRFRDKNFVINKALSPRLYPSMTVATNQTHNKTNQLDTTPIDYRSRLQPSIILNKNQCVSNLTKNNKVFHSQSFSSEPLDLSMPKVSKR